MSERIVRLIPAKPEGPPEFLDVADAEQWQYLRQVSGQPGEQIVQEQVFRPNRKQATAHEVTDGHCKVVYLLIRGESQQEIAEITQAIQKRMRILTEDELWSRRAAALTQSDCDEKIRTISHLALVAPSAFDERYFSAIEQSLRAPEAEVRYGTLKAAGYTGWREFLPTLEQIAKSDPEVKVRNFAGYLADGLKQGL